MEGLGHGVLHRVRRHGPDLDELLPTLGVGDDPLEVLALDLSRLRLESLEDLSLLRRRLHVLEPDRKTGSGGEVKAEFLDRVQGAGDIRLVVTMDDLRDQRPHIGLVDHAVDVGEAERERLVEERPAEGGLGERVRLDGLGCDQVPEQRLEVAVDGRVPGEAPDTKFDRRMEREVAGLVRHTRLVDMAVGMARSFGILDQLG